MSSIEFRQKMWMFVGVVLALALLICGIVMAMRKKSEKDSEEDYQQRRRFGSGFKVGGTGVWKFR